MKKLLLIMFIFVMDYYLIRLEMSPEKNWKRSSSLPARAVNKMPQKCYFYRKGYCKWGPFCRYQHKITYVQKPLFLFTTPITPKHQEKEYQIKLEQIREHLRKLERYQRKFSIREKLLIDWNYTLEKKVEIVSEEEVLKTRLLAAWREDMTKDQPGDEEEVQRAMDCYREQSSEELIRDLKCCYKVYKGAVEDGLKPPTLMGPNMEWFLGCYG